MKFIRLVNSRLKVKVDDEDLDKCGHLKWYLLPSKHIISTESYGRYLHRILMGLEKGDERQVDHINHNPLDNRRINLRICTRSQNRMNSKPQGGLSKYKGVTWNKINKIWLAQITVNSKNFYLGSFINEKEAAYAYDRAAKLHFGKFALFNF